MQNTLEQLQKSKVQTSAAPILSLSEALAKILVSWATEPDCKGRKAPLSDMQLKPFGDSSLTFLSGRMLRGCSSQNIATTFGVLSKRLPTLAVINLNGNCLIRHGFYPKIERESTLSDVLQKNVPETYILSLKPGDVYNGKLTPEQIKGVRMLTEIECERLQGFPDEFTKYGSYENETKVISRFNRYALLGNAVSVPVVKAVATRIKENTAIV